MKRATLYLLMITYAVSVVKPLLPFIADAVAHAFFYQKHIATVHWKNGKRHVHHEFVNEAKKNAKDGNYAKKMVEPDECTISEPGFKIITKKFQPYCLTLNSVETNAGYFNCFLPPPDIEIA